MPKTIELRRFYGDGAEPLEQAKRLLEGSIKPSRIDPELLGSSTNFPSCTPLINVLNPFRLTECTWAAARDRYRVLIPTKSYI